MSGADKRVLLGEVTGAHGIRGEVVVRSYTGDPGAIASYGALTDAAGASPLTLKIVRVGPKGVIARVVGVNDRNAAEALKGRKLFVAREAMPEPADDDFYHADLIGLAAVDGDGRPLGKVTAVENYGAGDLLEIKRDGGGTTELVPFTKAFVPVVDLAAQRIVIVMPAAVDDGDGADLGG